MLLKIIVLLKGRGSSPISSGWYFCWIWCRILGKISSGILQTMNHSGLFFFFFLTCIRPEEVLPHLISVKVSFFITLWPDVLQLSKIVFLSGIVDLKKQTSKETNSEIQYPNPNYFLHFHIPCNFSSHLCVVSCYPFPLRTSSKVDVFSRNLLLNADEFFFKVLFLALSSFQIYKYIFNTA